MSKNEIEKAISNIVDSLHLLTKVEKCYGEIRFHVVNGQLVEPSIGMKIYGTLSAVLIIIGYLYIMLSSWFDKKIVISYFDTDNSMFEKELLMVVFTFQYIVALAMFLRYDKENIKIIIALAHIDCSINVLNNKVFYKKSRKYNDIVIYVFLIMLMFAVVKRFLQNNCTLIYIIIYNVIDTLADYKFDLEALAFYVYIKILSERLDELNIHLKQFVNNKDKSGPLTIYQDLNKLDHGSVIGYVYQENTKLTSLAAIYEAIGETLTMIINLFTLNMFLYLASIFLYIILTLWSFVRFTRSNKHFTFLLGVIFECFEVIFVVVITCYICEKLTSKRQSTKVLVNEIVMDYKLPKEMRMQAKVFKDLIDAWPLQVHACNMICLNTQMLVNFIGLSSSYLIVMIQATIKS